MQLNKLKSKIKDGTKVTLHILSNVIGDYNDEGNFPRKYFLTETQVSSLYKAFGNNLSANIKFSKTKRSKILQFGEFLESLLLLFNLKQVLKPVDVIAIIYKIS